MIHLITTSTKDGFDLNDIPVQMLWLKYKAYKNGISPTEFYKQPMKDLFDVADIDSAIEYQAERMARLQAEMLKLSQM